MYSHQNSDQHNFRTNYNVLDDSWMQDSNRVTSGLDSMRAEVRQKTNPLGISWYLFVPLLAMTGLLLIPQMREFFLKAGWRWAHIFLLSFGISFCLNPIFSKIAFKLNMLDHPDHRKLHQEATPLLGGAAVFSGFLAALLINGIFSLELGAILISSMILFGVGVWDDYKEISAGLKLLTQIICASLVIFCGIVLRVIPLDLGLFAYTGNALLTLLWIIGITNAMNFFDGMDGLAAGLGALIAFFLGVVAFQTAQPFLGWVAVAMMGSCIGFLPYNFKAKGNATIFLGDAGSTIIGFILACIAVYGDWAESNTVVALISPILIFWILIFDMVHITLDRIMTGKVLNFRQWIEYVGKDHLHHRLANVLGGNKKSVLFIYLLSLCLGLSSVALRNARVVDAILLILQASIMVILITFLERRGRIRNAALDPNTLP
jgi:UDP-GlcNAc:undecaprenyl-phosphate GlcNAc-1-phosphate transferase